MRATSAAHTLQGACLCKAACRRGGCTAARGVRTMRSLYLRCNSLRSMSNRRCATHIRARKHVIVQLPILRLRQQATLALTSA
jgi:hypothetical protein